MNKKIRIFLIIFFFFLLCLNFNMIIDNGIGIIFILYIFFALVNGRKEKLLNKKQDITEEERNVLLGLEKDGKYESIDKKMKRVNPNFNEEEFSRQVRNIFIQYYGAVKAKDMKIIRLLATDDFALKCEKRILQNVFDVDDELDEIEEISIVNVEEIEDRDIVKVEIKFNEKNIEYNPKTKQKVTGLSGYKFSYTSVITLEKERKIIENKEEPNKKNCPNCGAPITITTIGRCNYCGKIIQIQEIYWKIRDCNTYRRRERRV